MKKDKAYPCPFRFDANFRESVEFCTLNCPNFQAVKEVEKDLSKLEEQEAELKEREISTNPPEGLDKGKCSPAVPIAIIYEIAI